MELFSVPTGKRVRITSKLIRWVDGDMEAVLAENFTWEGTTTDRYCFHRGTRRRLIINHTIDWPEFGVWQRNTDCEVISPR